MKLEGGKEILESVDRILSAGIPVMGHLGLTPQSIHKYGTYNVRAKEEAEAQKLIQDAHLLEEAGCFGIVLVTHDMLGINSEFSPRFLRRYANLSDTMSEAFGHYIRDVKSGDFPSEKEQY